MIETFVQVFKNLYESNPVTDAYWTFIWILMIILAIVVADVSAKR